jgi:phosphoglycerate dehydrogenase-like enzyme
VLVPDELGMSLIAGRPRLRGLRYELGTTPTAEQAGARAIVVGLPDVEAATTFFRQLPSLALVQTLSAGYEQWVGKLPPGVALSNAAGAHGAPVAEWVVAVLLAHVRELHDFADAQRSHRWAPHRTGSLSGKKVLVLGAGDVGRHTARLLKAFGCVVTLAGRTARGDVQAVDDAVERPGDAEVIVLAVPLTRATEHLVDAAFLARLADGAVLVNAGRGRLVDTDALVTAARTGRISALLDVVDPEPLPADHPLWEAPRVRITPHVAGGTPGLWERGWAAALEALEKWASGAPVKDLNAPDHVP